MHHLFCLISANGSLDPTQLMAVPSHLRYLQSPYIRGMSHFSSIRIEKKSRKLLEIVLELEPRKRQAPSATPGETLSLSDYGRCVFVERGPWCYTSLFNNRMAVYNIL